MIDLDWLAAYAARWHGAWEIVGALATSAAVIVALLAARHEAHARKRAEVRAEVAEAQRDRERSEADAQRIAENRRRAVARRREQGLRLIAWAERSDLTREELTAGGKLSTAALNARPWKWSVRMVNHSDMPAFDVSAHIADQLIELGFLVHRAVLPAGAEVVVDLPSALQGLERPVAFLYFRDLPGVLWRRWQDGRLEELDKNGHPIAEPPASG